MSKEDDDKNEDAVASTKQRWMIIVRVGIDMDTRQYEHSYGLQSIDDD
jgi:hypothetical protein